jgi:hypothetical protein
VHPLKTISAGLGVLSTIAFGLPTIVVDMVLLCRVLAVIPPSRTSKRVLFAIYPFPVLSKVTRLALVAVFCVMDFRDISHGDKFDGSTKIELRIEEAMWILNVLDNACAHPFPKRGSLTS